MSDLKYDMDEVNDTSTHDQTIHEEEKDYITFHLKP
jgi:hypothetical protein